MGERGIMYVRVRVCVCVCLCVCSCVPRHADVQTGRHVAVWREGCPKGPCLGYLVPPHIAMCWLSACPANLSST